MVLTIGDITNSLRLPVMNDYFLQYILPDITELNKQSKNNFDNPIKHKKIVIFADIGSGKSSLMRAINGKVINKYKIDNVNSVISSDIESLIIHGLDKKLIQYHAIDDYTLVKENVDVILAEGVNSGGIGLAVMNRLRKASGYHIIKTE